MSLHILIGHEKPGQRGHAEALYVGPSGVDLQAAKAKATCGSFTILSNPQGQRKSNAAYDPSAKLLIKVDATTGEAAVVLVPVTIGEGDEALVINVSNDNEARFIQEIASALREAIAQNATLKSAGDELAAVSKVALASLQQEIDALRATLAADRDSAIATAAAARDEQIKALEASLAERDAQITALNNAGITETKPKAKK